MFVLNKDATILLYKLNSITFLVAALPRQEINDSNNFKRSFDRILRKVGIKKRTFHEIRKTAIAMWLANGMSEYDVMTLAGHSSFATTHKFYLAVTNDLIHRARAATAKGLSQKMGRFGTRALADIPAPHITVHKSLPQKKLQMGRGGFEPPTHGFSVRCSTN
jgi:integrase